MGGVKHSVEEGGKGPSGVRLPPKTTYLGRPIPPYPYLPSRTGLEINGRYAHINVSYSPLF